MSSNLGSKHFQRSFILKDNDSSALSTGHSQGWTLWRERFALSADLWTAASQTSINLELIFPQSFLFTYSHLLSLQKQNTYIIVLYTFLKKKKILRKLYLVTYCLKKTTAKYLSSVINYTCKFIFFRSRRHHFSSKFTKIIKIPRWNSTNGL